MWSALSSYRVQIAMCNVQFNCLSDFLFPLQTMTNVLLDLPAVRMAAWIPLGLSHVLVEMDTISQQTDTLALVGWPVFVNLTQTDSSWGSLPCSFIVDYNECAIDNGGCDHKCENYGGYFLCGCDAGYVLHADGKTCFSGKSRGTSS